MELASQNVKLQKLFSGRLETKSDPVTLCVRACMLAILYLVHGDSMLPRKFITGSTAEQRPSCVGGEVLLRRWGCERLCWKTSERIFFFSAVKQNYRNAHRQLPSLICVSQQSSRTNEKPLVFRCARQCVRHSNKAAIDQTYYYTDDNWGKRSLWGPKGYLRSMSQVNVHCLTSPLSEPRLWKRVIDILSQSSCLFRWWEEKKKPHVMNWFMGDTHQFSWRLHSRGDG